MKRLYVATRRGTVLNGALFSAPGKADTLVIAITGIHGNFYSNPFYYDIGDALNTAGIDFAYAQTRNAFGVIRTRNVLTRKEEVIGSWNERFDETDEDITAYLDEAERRGYRHIVLAKTAIQYIALSRPLIREPNLINRWQSGDIRPSTCVSCNACYRTSAHTCLFTVSH